MLMGAVVEKRESGVLLELVSLVALPAALANPMRSQELLRFSAVTAA